MLRINDNEGRFSPDVQQRLIAEVTREYDMRNKIKQNGMRECNCFFEWVLGNQIEDNLPSLLPDATLAPTKTGCRHYMHWWKTFVCNESYKFPKLCEIWSVVSEIEDPILALLCLTHEQ